MNERPRYFRRVGGFRGPDAGATVLLSDRQIFLIRPDKSCIDLAVGYTREMVIELLITGKWVELDKPYHENGRIIRRYTRIRSAGVRQ